MSATGGPGIEQARPCIVVVDDELPQMRALADVLGRDGYVVRACTTGEEALALLASDPCDVLLTDLLMPGMDGIELIRRAVAADPDLVAVLMTGHGSISTAVEAMRTGAIDYVLKPFRLDAMRPVLGRAIEIRRLRTSNRELQAGLVQRTAQLEEANRDLDAFAGRVAHDLRAPLNRILGFAEALEESCAPSLDPEDRHMLERIVVSGRRAAELAHDLLEFARLGQRAMDCREVDLDEVLDKARRMTEIEGIAPVSWEIDPMPRVRADPSLLQEVFENLFSNAVKYSKGRDAPRVEVRYARDPSLGHVVTVRDWGVGFDSGLGHRLFTPFVRLHDATQFEGVGLGLANVKRIVERHGGTVRAESRVGEGAAFHVSLPLD